jgi:hypothetical protein
VARSLVLGRRGTVQRKKGGGGVLEARFCVEGPLAARPFKFKLTVDSSFGGAPGEPDLLISLAGQLLPFFQGRQPPPPLPWVVCSEACGVPFADELAEALSYERFECEVRPQHEAAENWIAPGAVKGNTQLHAALVVYGAHRETWGAMKVNTDQALSSKVAARLRAWVAPFARKANVAH